MQQQHQEERQTPTRNVESQPKEFVITHASLAAFLSDAGDDEESDGWSPLAARHAEAAPAKVDAEAGLATEVLAPQFAVAVRAESGKSSIMQDVIQAVTSNRRCPPAGAAGAAAQPQKAPKALGKDAPGCSASSQSFRSAAASSGQPPPKGRGHGGQGLPLWRCTAGAFLLTFSAIAVNSCYCLLTLDAQLEALARVHDSGLSSLSARAAALEARLAGLAGGGLDAEVVGAAGNHTLALTAIRHESHVGFAAVKHQSEVVLNLLIASTSMLTCMVLGMGMWISRQLRVLGVLGRLMSSLGQGDEEAAVESSGDLARAASGRRSSIRQVRELQDAVCRVAHGIDRFARFVPRDVVQRILLGDPRAARLHVDRREVTIMFSDIQDFTTISERLNDQNPRDFLFVLMRYFTVMTQIVDTYEGAVGEILGDGVLAFWNTPVLADRHEAKACTAAVCQQLAMKYLNEEFEALGLPSLKIRIGVHTGTVLTGNIGTFSKMKFGCIGDPVNLAARLEGLCKEYGVSTICSGATHVALAPSDGFLCRRLDLVQVKGKTQATEIFEVIGCGRPHEQALSGESAGQPENSSVSFPGTLPKSQGDFIPVASEVASFAAGASTGDSQTSTRAFALSWSQSSVATEAEEDLEACADGQAAADDAGALHRREHVLVYEHALQLFQEGSFELARALCEDLLRAAPGDVPSRKLRDRAAEGAARGTDAQGWTGVNVMHAK